MNQMGPLKLEAQGGMHRAASDVIWSYTKPLQGLLLGMQRASRYKKKKKSVAVVINMQAGIDVNRAICCVVGRDRAVG